ncbi:32027_t:CDS:2, partial [Racocetra persica]
MDCFQIKFNVRFPEKLLPRYLEKDIFAAELPPDSAQNSRVLQFWADVTYREEDDKSSKN